MIYKDALSGKMKTWPYGTIKKVVVEAVEGGQYLVVKGAEGFLLLGIDPMDVEPGDHAEIIFKEGGPSGGYWDFVRGPRTLMCRCLACGAENPFEVGKKSNCPGCGKEVYLEKETPGRRTGRIDTEQGG